MFQDPQPAVKMSGEADFHNQAQITDAFNTLFDSGLFIIQADLSDLCYIDSSGISALIKCAKKAASAGGEIILTGISSPVSRVLTLCGAAVFFKSSISEVQVSADDNPSRGSLWHVSDFSLPGTPAAAAIARNRVADVIDSLPFSHNERQDIMVAFGEALANAIKHGCTCQAEKKITVKCVASSGRLSIDVCDPGSGFSPDRVPPPSPNSLAEGGMGIYIMREIMDEVSYTFDGCTKCRLVKSIKVSGSGEIHVAAEHREIY